MTKLPGEKNQTAVNVVLGFLYINIGRPQDVILFFKHLHLGVIFTLATLYFILNRSKEEKSPQGITIIENKLLIYFVVIMFISTLFSIYPRRSVEFLQEYAQMLVLYIGLTSFLNSFSDFKKFAITILLSVLTLTVPIFLGGVSTERISVGSYYDPNDLAMFIACSFPFVIYLLHTGKIKVKMFSIVALGLGLIAIIATQSRMGLLAVALLGLLYVVLGVSNQKQFFKKIIILGGMVALMFSFAGAHYWERMGTTFKEGNTGSGRTIIWKRALTLVPENPLLGTGPNTFMSAYGRKLVSGGFKSAGAVYDRKWKTAHNSYIVVLVELGLPALMIYISIIFLGIKNLLKIKVLYSANGDELIPIANICLMCSLVFLFCAFFLNIAHSPIFVMTISGNIFAQKLNSKKQGF